MLPETLSADERVAIDGIRYDLVSKSKIAVVVSFDNKKTNQNKINRMCKVKMTLQIKRIGLECSEISFNNPPFLFCYKEDDKCIDIAGETFEGDINGYVFPIHASIDHNHSYTNYDLIINGKKLKCLSQRRKSH